MPDEVNYRGTLAYSHACQELLFTSLLFLSIWLCLLTPSLLPWFGRRIGHVQPGLFLFSFSWELPMQKARFPLPSPCTMS